MREDFVTCVMITRPAKARLALVERSVAAYLRQTYPSRELLVVLDAADEGDRTALEQRLNALGRSDIRVIRAPGAPSVGRLRNIGIEAAQGDLICVWDDDDFHHPARIETQVAALRLHGVIATFLTDMLHLFMESRELFWTTYKRAAQRCVPGTGIFRRRVTARYPEEGPESLRGEDTVFCLRLFEEGPVYLMDGAPHLYIYVCHGGNTSGTEFHRMVASSLSLSRGRVARAEALVHEALDLADHGLERVDVMGSNGPAFVWRRHRPELSPARGPIGQGDNSTR
jgi:glycosyltransferase involved in cell wall biosynthesis